MSTEGVIAIVLQVMQLSFVLAAAIWAYFRFWRERSHMSRMEFDVSCRFHGPQDGRFLAEFTLGAHNKGLVIHKFPSIRLRVRGIKSGAALQSWEGSRVLFPEKILDNVEVVYKKKNPYLFVEPGVEQRIGYVTTIPTDCAFIIARAEFRYDSERSHSAERVFTVRATEAA
jgi:hypothetical protein